MHAPAADRPADAHRVRALGEVAAVLGRLALVKDARVLKVLVRVAVLAQLPLLVGRRRAALGHREPPHQLVPVHHRRPMAVLVPVLVSMIMSMVVVVVMRVLVAVLVAVPVAVPVVVVVVVRVLHRQCRVFPVAA